MNTQECDKPAEPQERRRAPDSTSPEDWARFLRAACAGCRQQPC